MDLPEQQEHTLHREQKTGFVLLLLFGLIGIGMGALQMRNTLYSPFVFKAPETKATDSASLLEDETVKQQALDTDKDGINNYEELNFYQTSPYLADTDSDGISDKEEIQTGEDPLCPKGTVCGDSGIGSIPDENSIATEPILSSGNKTGSVEDLLSNVNADISQGNDTDLGALVEDVESIRELIRRTGKLSEEQLKAIDDQTLLKLVSQFTDKDQATSTTTSN